MTGITFYYSAGSSAVAAHILLEEAQIPYKAIHISIPDGAHRSPDFLAVSPKGRLPVLVVDGTTITENPAILELIADAHPAAGLGFAAPLDQAAARSVCSYLASTAHVAFAHLHRGARWADTAQAHADMAQRVAGNLSACAAFMESDLAFAPFAMGERYSFVDPYVFQFCRWMQAAGVPLTQFPKLQRFHDDVANRPATQKVQRLHGF